jgi:hypothetical protein
MALVAPRRSAWLNRPVRPPISSRSQVIGCALLGSVIAWDGTAQAARDLTFDSAEHVNEGALSFLATPPDRPVHHHQNRIRIDPDSLISGWVELAQCHDNLDAVPSAQITFRDGFVRDLKVRAFSLIEHAWIEGASVQLRNVQPGARLCLSAQTRALRSTGNGFFNLFNGPYMRKFLDGYYPMHVTLEVGYPAQILTLIDISPSAQPGLEVVEQPGEIRIDAVFEGELQTLIQFQRN